MTCRQYGEWGKGDPGHRTGPKQTAQICHSQGTPPGGTLGVVQTGHKIGSQKVT